MTSYSDEYFWSRVDKSADNGCWLWIGAKLGTGYGVIGWGQNRILAHRYAYEFLLAPIPEGHQLDHRHTCPKNCVNPEHLRPATYKQNNENHAGAQANCKSGIRGVYWHRTNQKWCVQITHNYQKYYVGCFANIEEAESAAIAKRNELFTHNDLDREVMV